MSFPPVVSDRLNELLRQRALLQEHLAWLDREISAANGPGQSGEHRSAAGQTAQAAVAQAGAATPASPIASVTVIPSTPAIPAADAEALIARYGYDPKSSSADVKRGCWLAFAGAFVVLAAVVTAAWFLLRKP